MSLLTLIESVTDRLALPRLTTVVGNTNDQARLLLALANEEGRELAARGTWQVLVNEITFTTQATESQGTIDGIVAYQDYGRILNDVMWNRTTGQKIIGAITAQQWQEAKARATSSTLYPMYRFRGNTLLMTPTPTAGQTVAFEYVQSRWVRNFGETLEYPQWNDDTDVGLLSESIMANGVLWRFKRQKGFDYAEEFAAYERQVADALARDGGKPAINFNGSGYDPLCPPSYAEGSWGV